MCLMCNDERVVWEYDKQWGMVTCQPCPNCNKGGMNVKKEYEEWIERLKGANYEQKPHSVK